ncbi:helix-turn-helix domain-containing protein, partial [Candidatus Woesearchaeota archaeon]|nr:helix-turn-helix domain-containing protein [Candidatus Woesearchaeota archaeon]
MMEKLIHPQEVEVFYLLPALRRDIAISLKTLGRDQKQIAKILGVSEPSVSHYFNSKRGADVEFSNDVKAAIRKSATAIKTPK